ncbi:hypothetical protein QJS10_CPB12g00569 [Acorus calamus]|uniref:Uncharacterized protein n=1 Tax=Acorus calamus TaxID=4465 RepID=A0AAV9DMH3_ACOCL|nr:hypothetical protein QJS10_CPB12g00569 [Acorus calamus]
MQSDSSFYYGEAAPSNGYGAASAYNAFMGGYNCNTSIPPTANAAPTSMKQVDFLSGVNFQASKVCPKKFIIFDQTDEGNRIMFHPAFPHKFNSSRCSGVGENYGQENGRGCDSCKDYDSSSTKEIEDSEDIDALLSMGEEFEDEDDVLSTGRTPSYNMESSPDTCSTDESDPNCKPKSKSEKPRLSFILRSSSRSSSKGSERKRERMKKMVNALRGIVPAESKWMRQPYLMKLCGT